MTSEDNNAPPATRHPSPLVTPHQLLAAYENGYFPMALAADDPELYWFSPEERGVLPLGDGFHIPTSLAKFMKTQPYRITVDTAFEQVIRACGTRNETWINETIVSLYTELHRMGHAHSVEVWDSSNAKTMPRVGSAEPEGQGSASNAREGGVSPPSNKQLLIGGLYGVSLGGAFFGESMFSRASNASKIALVSLVELLREAGYALLDTQYVNDHLKQFGVEAMPKETYMMKLANALSASPNPSTRFSTVSVRKGLASSSSDSST